MAATLIFATVLQIGANLCLFYTLPLFLAFKEKLKPNWLTLMSYSFRYTHSFFIYPAQLWTWLPEFLAYMYS